jgi:hypothetical protein
MKTVLVSVVSLIIATTIDGDWDSRCVTHAQTQAELSSVALLDAQWTFV